MFLSLASTRIRNSWNESTFQGQSAESMHAIEIEQSVFSEHLPSCLLEVETQSHHIEIGAEFFFGPLMPVRQKQADTPNKELQGTHRKEYNAQK